MKKGKLTKYVVMLVVAIALLFAANLFLDSYQLRIINLCGIYVILALSMNLINGFTGLFSLGHAGFMAVGAYTVGLLTMNPTTKQMNFYMKPIVPWLAEVELGFLPAILLAGIVTAFVALLIGAPVLKLTDDYLAIATLGFSEIIRILLTNMQSVSNGALGLKGIPNRATTPWTWGLAIFTIIVMTLLINSSYGKAFKAIREDDIAARSMGINIFSHKLLSFVIGAFFAGVGGGLMGSQLGTISPDFFKFTYTFNILLIVVLGGMGSIKGNVVSAIVITIAMEVLRFLDGPLNLGFTVLPALPGLRMVVFSLILMLVVLFRKDSKISKNIMLAVKKHAKTK
ncbi:branched-chain amino acid ABC transporter permease [Youngiibacter multivorans]|uniref:Branched-chain amino acid transport system permease protein n=1 Tax=Youngiibacter multivorans TaxID=937251 RepID=A0ABS4G3E5_9CLOT|nr:branched-chain amino acid ABC transporter permease [Youngiibacter multivorans]MBP1918860.1 branched-chain amino acid transport system permease protein [Youngiibacter multivorans]